MFELVYFVRGIFEINIRVRYFGYYMEGIC